MTRRGARPGFIGLTLGCLALVALAVGVIWVATVGSFWLIDRLVDLVPRDWEQQLAVSQVEASAPRAIHDPVVTNALNGVFGRLVKALPSDQPYHFRLHPVWDVEENAYALPGGDVLITSALIAASRSPDEVAGVLGHEAQHVIARHTLRGMARKVGITFALDMLLGDQGVGGAIARGSSSLLGLGFDRSQEAEADQAGERYADAAGYQPRAMADFFRRQMDVAQQDPRAAEVMALLSDHPADEDRLDQILALANRLPRRPRPSARTLAAWKVVRAHAAAIPAAFKHAPRN